MRSRSRHLRRSLGALVLTLSVGACASLRRTPPVPSPSAHAELGPLLAQASQDVLAGRYGVADRTLADFVQRYPESAEAADATLARALYKLDPANQSGTAREAIALLEGYTTNPALDAPHRATAAALRRAAQALAERSTAAAPTVSPAAAPSSTAADKAKDEELARLKEELTKANAELERIKRRLATPKP